MNINTKKIHSISQEFFYALTLALVAFVIMEVAWPRIVLAYININIVLLFWIANAIVLFTSTEKN